MPEKIMGRDVSITFYGHSAFKLSGQGVNVVIDPWLSNPLLDTPVDKVGPVEVILVTHGHGDHVGETVALAKATHAQGSGHSRAFPDPGRSGRARDHRHEQGGHPGP